MTLYNIMKEFKDTQSVAVLHGCPMRIKAPADIAKDYVNRIEYHTIVLQGLVDNKNSFQNIFVRWSGKSHDVRISRNSSLYRECLQRSFLPHTLSQNINGKDVSPLYLMIRHLL